ncbi:short chain dehydrogenase reductase [Dactylonectria estremocensis]|uniref:Short chain dehydrogenase reductase n=1 Tax=Dactylonectria estremocensis TaxID=1079267 RepID=A0A9P9E9T7_9HYPO|nr:short chain dehydrogenase reductase [Dactylonectria estremocensis]
MSIPEYQDNGPVMATNRAIFNELKNKSVIITGGASGLGKAYAKAFVEAGAFVTIGDYDEAAGSSAEQELSPNAAYVKCDVRDWDQQVALFRTALESSPHKSIDIVIANAGIVGADDFNTQQDDFPSKPDLRILDVNLTGTAYTAYLALHFFRIQPEDASRDRCLIIKGSIAAYADQPGSPQYNMSKWGARGLFRNLRRVSWRDGVRVNFVAPWYVRTPILADKIIQYLESKDVKFATVEDCARAMMQIASEKNINGRSFGIVPKDEATQGYMDLEHDDYQDGDFLKSWQETVLATAEAIVKL